MRTQGYSTSIVRPNNLATFQHRNRLLLVVVGGARMVVYVAFLALRGRSNMEERRVYPSTAAVFCLPAQLVPGTRRVEELQCT